MKIRRIIYGCGVLFVMLCAAVAAQQPVAPGAPGRQGGAGAAPGRVPGPPPAPLFFRETWKQRPDGQQHPVARDVVSNATLELKLYGASAREILVTGTSTGPLGMVWLFNGLATTPVAVTLRHKDSYVDLSGAAKSAGRSGHLAFTSPARS